MGDAKVMIMDEPTRGIDVNAKYEIQSVLRRLTEERGVFIAFGPSGMLASMAGILFASRKDAAQPSVGEGWLMGAITAAILGGTSLRGRQGSIMGTVMGALPLPVLANGTVLMTVSGFWQRVIVGAVVLIAVLVDLLRRRSN